MERIFFQCSCTPPLNAAYLGVEVSFKRVVEVDDLAKVGPTQMSTQRVDNLDWKNLPLISNRGQQMGCFHQAALALEESNFF